MCKRSSMRSASRALLVAQSNICTQSCAGRWGRPLSGARCPARWQEHGFVFTTTIGTPLEPRNVNRSFQAALNKAGVPRINFHALRHTCASLLLAQKALPREVMDLLGHSKMDVTMNTYTHLTA